MRKEIKLGDICNILNGYAFKSKEYLEDGIRVIRITNVQKGNIEDNDPKYYDISKIKELKNYILKENDLLISLTGNVGRVGLLPKKLLPAGLNQRVGCLRIKDEKNVSIEYLYQYFNSYNFERDCINNSKGIAQKNLSTEWLKNYKVSIPNLNEQNRIVNKLKKIQRLKKLKEQQLKELNQLIKSQFVEMFDNKNYPKIRLKEVLVQDQDVEKIENTRKEKFVTVGINGKGAREREVYFDARTKIHLQNYLNSRTDNNPALFVSLLRPYDRLKVSGVEIRLRELGKKINIKKIHPHKFRRTMATKAIDKGMPIEQVQVLLGHRKIDTTLQYAMVNQNNVRNSHKKFIC